MSDGYIHIVGWDRHQHRDAARSSVPTWIKNHTRLLSDDNYLALSAHQRAVLHGLWLEYARSRCQLSANTASLTRRLALRVSLRQLEALSHAGFITLSAGNRARLEVEREVEDKEQELAPPPRAAVEKSAKPRPPDIVWDFVAAIEGEPLPRYKQARGRIVSDLKTLLADTPPDRHESELRRRHGALAREWGDSKATARALVQHWHRAAAMAAPTKNGTHKGGFLDAKTWVIREGWQYPEADLVEDLAKKFILADVERITLRELANNLQKEA